MSFDQAFSDTMRREGGYRLHEVKGDKGGPTYAGIARNRWPRWPGWAYLDRGETPPTELVRQFYRENFWKPLKADQMLPGVAETVYDFGVNAGTGTAAKLAQLVVGVEPDGQVGPKTLAALSELRTIEAMSPEAVFRAVYALAKLKRYAAICTKDPSQKRFLHGWVNRLLEAA